MRYRFYINPETNQPHVLDHSVFEQEVIEAFENGFEDRHAVNKARSRIGQTYAGR
ncbi:MAG TPA: hypothetical protein PKO06_21400 [Candidatus Ozemobacteraceae bacterium]|nr:hypothetical protein [Candidatus Ozemobacteraceae bacterium]